ncbi:MAG: dissimilatory-type sulfite reductase subunit alpha [Myxococcales bacterium]|nr:MAG: dissimilatory-type sulfite reductase subunit alpha [Myxococcales bacterium]
MSKTPLLDELEKGPWPSFVREIKRAAEKKPMSADLLVQLEQSYVDKVGHWKHGGIVGVRSYGGGVIGRYSDMADKVPAVAEFHTMRVNQPAGWFYTSTALRTLCDIWDKHGSGLTNMHGSTGDIIFLGTTTDHLQATFNELSDAGFDLGGSGSDLRTPSCCVGQARCEWACFDSMALVHDLTNNYQDELHRPMWPYKFKIKISACPNDCVAAIARSDFAIIGTWKDNIQIDQAAVAEYAKAGMDISENVVFMCPSRCMRYDAATKKLTINNNECTRCMHCINVMPKALRPGKEKGATILIGAKAPIVEGAILGHVLVPFIKIEPPYTEIKELLEKLWEWWDENGKNRERIGEAINRHGMRAFLKALDIPAKAQMVAYPRENPFFFWDKEQVEAEIASRKK